MATTRLFTLLGPSIFRNSGNSSQFQSFNFNKICLPSSLRLNRHSFSALVLDSDASTLSANDSSPISAHPWPEWVNFVDRLKAKGYLTQNAAALENDGSSIDDGAAVYSEMKLVKDACLSFARDRFDIFKSLSRQDIQRVVEKGCPNLHRKGVNSAKRLRAYLGLDEGDVCSSCNLRGSCDRAYIILNDSEAAARTVDIVRILLLYALDPLVISGENKHPDGEFVESSARKLLSQLNELGETPPAPELPKLASTTSGKKQQSLDALNNERLSNVEMKPGYWLCAKCNFINFARNIQCLKCKEERPKSASVCGVEKKKGDWDCPQCSFMNFASKRQCFRCQEPRPQRQLRPGDWECPNCDFVNFSRNTVCRKCNLDHPLNSRMQYDDQTWKGPK